MAPPLNPLVIEAVLHPTDVLDTHPEAIAHALKLALLARGRLSYLHVGPPGREVAWREFPVTRKVLATWGVLPEGVGHEAMFDLGLTIRKSLRKGGDVATEIAGEIRKAGADLVVMASQDRRGLTGLLPKGTASGLARRLDRPVLFVPAGRPGFVEEATGAVRLERVVIPSARELEPRGCLEAALGLAMVACAGAVQLTVLHFGDPEDQPKLTFPGLRAGWKLEVLPVEGGIATVLPDEAVRHGADLVVVPAFAPLGWRERLRGSLTEQVVRACRCPVLTVPP